MLLSVHASDYLVRQAKVNDIVQLHMYLKKVDLCTGVTLFDGFSEHIGVCWHLSVTYLLRGWFSIDNVSWIVMFVVWKWHLPWRNRCLWRTAWSTGGTCWVRIYGSDHVCSSIPGWKTSRRKGVSKLLLNVHR